MGLEALFAPQAVAVVGASQRELTIGHRIVRNLLEFGYTGPIYPVNPKAGQICGLRAYRSILDVPVPVDVAHIVIRSALVPECVEECARRGVKVVIVNSAGFRETGPAGAGLEERLVAIARRRGIRVFGPNCQGIINTDPGVRAYCNFTFTRPRRGNISIVAQSGGVGELIHQRITELGAGVRKYASNGNACDVSIPEIIAHYGSDEQTAVILVHIESLAEPRAFLEAARAVARAKPVLAIKAGRTRAGARAACSHTGRLVQQQGVIEPLFEKAGVVAFGSIEELCQAALGFSLQPVPAGNRVGMIANTGGPAIIATDELIEQGLLMPPLSERSAALLRERLHPEAAVSNPIDVLATAGPEHFAAALDALLNDDGIDAVLLNFVTPFFVDTLGIAQEIAAAGRRCANKPIIATVMTEKKGWAQTLAVIRGAGVPTYDMPETAARVLGALSRYAALRRRAVEPPARFADADAGRARAILRAAARAGRSRLTAAEAYPLLACYGIPVARYRVAGSPAECLEAAEDVGYPVVLKIDAQGVVHKSESGGVVAGIGDRRALRRRAEELAARFGERGAGFLVQEEVRGGRELALGAQAVPGLGHVLMFGLGGVLLELLRDVSFKLAPLSEREAREMIESLRAYRLLEGQRGQPGVDQVALRRIILRLGQMLSDNPAIRELDINPILALPGGAVAVDVRVML